MQIVLNHVLIGTCLGVFLTLASIVIRVRNPARIPIINVILKAVPGLVLYLTVWVIFSHIAFLIFCSMFKLAGIIGATGLWLVAAAHGIAVPQVRRLQDLIQLLPRNLTNYSLFRALQDLNEGTSQYLGRIIDREERKLSLAFLRLDAAQRLVVDALFEYHKIHIAHQHAHDPSPDDDEDPCNIFYVNCVEMKIRFLTRFLGYKVFSEVLVNSVKKPGTVFPTWPPGIYDRRKGDDRRKKKLEIKRGEERRIRPNGRRKTDSIYLRRWVVGKLRSLKKYGLGE